ncbi:hypothetical protein ARMGADRAFT_1011949 [Armillaria gallica]|uniref:Ricin B lectin domain-containing protein n=1 Tax=Armillaria gallica TaxID=47427 RepID=A0A2H3DK92_ARMGA|nr:hypothetical protein ARMGADRAFT_1011949 [Armillaria gallica]
MFSSVIFLSALIFSVATASPLEVRSTCHPDFEGAILTVANYGTIPAWSFKWSSDPTVGSPVIADNSPSKWSLQQNGDYDPPTYTVKNVDNLLLAVELDGGKLIMDNVDWSGSNVDQKWKVECASCATDIAHQTGVVASGCNISPASPSANGLCVGHTGFRSQLSLVACPSGEYGSFYFSVSD